MMPNTQEQPEQDLIDALLKATTESAIEWQPSIRRGGFEATVGSYGFVVSPRVGLEVRELGTGRMSGLEIDVRPDSSTRSLVKAASKFVESNSRIDLNDFGDVEFSELAQSSHIDAKNFGYAHATAPSKSESRLALDEYRDKIGVAAEQVLHLAESMPTPRMSGGHLTTTIEARSASASHKRSTYM